MAFVGAAFFTGQNFLPGRFEVFEALGDLGEYAHFAEWLGVAVENADCLAPRVEADIARLHVQDFVLRIAVERHHDDQFLAGEFGMGREGFTRQTVGEGGRHMGRLFVEQFRHNFLAVDLHRNAARHVAVSFRFAPACAYSPARRINRPFDITEGCAKQCAGHKKLVIPDFIS